MPGYIGNPVSSTMIQQTKKEIFEFTATSGQTVFSGNDINGYTLEYKAGLILISLNGAWLDQAEYTADDGSTIILTEAAYLNQSLKVLVFDSFDMIDTYTKNQSDQKFLTSDPETARTALDVQTIGESATVHARNCAINQEPVTQGMASRAGMSSKIYTGNGTSQSISTGLDMNTGDFGGLVWTKSRDSAFSNRLWDTVRGVGKGLLSDATSIETAEATGVTSFDSAGFSVGALNVLNTNLDDVVAWSFQTTKKNTGVTNRNKAFTAHFNPDMNFSIVGYEGDGVDGHEIPHHLGVVPELSIFKGRDDAVEGWPITSSLFNVGDWLYLNTTAAKGTGSTTLDHIPTDTTIKIGTNGGTNFSAENFISYHFASKSGVCKIGKYIGTGAAGNYVSTEVDGGDAFKPSFVMVKDLSSANAWIIQDTMRGYYDLYPNTSGADNLAARLEFNDNGFVLTPTTNSSNQLNSEYIFMAFAETNIDSTKATTDYTYPSTADRVSIAPNTLVSVANGYNANGQVDTQFQFGAGVNHILGVGYENKKLWLYSDNLGNTGTSEFRPLEGITRDDADKYGEQSPSDASLRTTSKHFDYESESGVSLASTEDSTFESYKAFNKNSNDIVTAPFYWRITSTAPSWVQYKHTEKRILKSWRMREISDSTYTPKLFTIEGSNDGLNWTAIDSTYTASDYIGNGSRLWGDLQSTSGNTTAYLYHRINITANNGHVTYTGIAEVELNTILPSDYYLINDGRMYDSADIAIERVYLAELWTDAQGDVIRYENLPISKSKVNDIDIHGKLTAYQEVLGKQFATAWVNFDGTQNPPLILDSFNVKDIVDIGPGNFKIIFEEPMDKLGYVVDISSSVTVASTALISCCLERDGAGILGFSIDTSYVNSTTNKTNFDYPDNSVIVFGGKEIK